jgi:serine/threonine protein kinase
MFDREVSVMATVNHAALIRLLGFVPVGKADGDPPSIVFEFAARRALQDTIKPEWQMPPEWDMTRRYVSVFGVAVGMMTLHGLRIIHRDLKPENVLLDDALEPKVADFGLAKFVPVGASVHHSSSMGTPLYQSPEMLESDVYNWSVDVYAFGVLFNAVMAGEDPYTGMGIRKSFALAAKVMAGTRPVMPQGTRPAWKQFIEKCWSGATDDRPTFEAIVREMADRAFIGDEVDMDIFTQYQKKVTVRAL